LPNGVRLPMLGMRKSRRGAAKIDRGGDMKTLRGWTAAVAVVALTLAAQASAAGPTAVSNTYTVGGQSVPGVSTGLVLTSGMTVTVTAAGAVCPFGGSFCPGPNGYVPWDTTQSSYGGFPLPGAPAWGLIGRVGGGPWVQIGTGPKKLSGTGELAFAVNDDLLADNAGSFTVTVSYSCWPGWGYGDKNHTHCGPPGLAGKSTPAAGSGNNGNGKGNGSAGTAPNGNGKGNGPAADPNGDGNGNGNGNGNVNGNGDGNGNGNGAADTAPNGNGKGNGLAKH
jgi:hypothetical protein